MNNRNNPLAQVVMALFGIVVTASFALYGVANMVTSFSCGQGFDTFSLFGSLQFLFTGDTTRFGTAGTCPIPADGIRVGYSIVGVLAAVFPITGFVLWRRWKESDAYFKRDLQLRDGFARGAEVKKFLGRKPAMALANEIRPTLVKPAITDVAWSPGKSRNRKVWLSYEDSVVLIGPPRSGKGWRVLIAAILDWGGPLITTSTRNDNLTTTLRARAKRGSVTVFDPQELSGIRSNLRISPVTGCRDPLVARQRAAAIVAGSGLGQSSNNPEWAQQAGDVIAGLLHAAAVSNGGTDALREWGSNPKNAKNAVKILRTDGAEGWADDLDSVVSGDEKMLASSWFGVRGALAPLAIPAIKQALNPQSDGEKFDPEEFLAGHNTLYMIGTGSGAGAVGGFLGAVLDDVVETARRKALASEGSRLDPPLGLILDEICNMFAWPALPTIMSDGGGIGIATLVVLQSLSQAETAWSSGQAETIWSSAIVKILLGGAGNVKHLNDLVSLLGQREVKTKTGSENESGTNKGWSLSYVNVMEASEMRRMPEDLGLLFRRNIRGALLDLKGWTSRADAADVIAGRRLTETGQREVFSEQYETRRMVNHVK